VRIEVSDDGVGMPEQRLESIRAELEQPLYQDELTMSAPDRGIGIRNVYIRYAIRYGDHFRFGIDSKPGAGTRISLLLDTEV
jgi:two-component system sensor histidine kinase YesM